MALLGQSAETQQFTKMGVCLQMHSVEIGVTRVQLVACKKRRGNVQYIELQLELVSRYRTCYCGEKVRESFCPCYFL